jgi:quinate dehydrogenase (quinone)
VQGEVDLSVGLGPYPDYYYMPTSQPLVAGDRVVVGGWVWDGKQTEQPSGVVRAYSLKTGELDWAWDLGNPATTKLPPEGQTYTKGTPNYWSSGAYDAKLNMVYLPLGNATPDFWAGHRNDTVNAYSTSIVALRADTGREVWHFQSCARTPGTTTTALHRR